ncbi:MAG: hypothetical protein H6737_31320 [Alphaproteobacteria bacterium]|nr:hypothetical protein [Alphaproteobacteria bacterium]
MWWALWLACAGPGRAVERVEEVADVPPPPGFRTLRLHGVDPAGIALGAEVSVRAGGRELARGDVVLDATQPPSITVYVPEGTADAVLAADGLTVR